ncbi:hypothetical protein N0O92_00550 [Alkalihalobacillus sp. MEB130]|uniref:hypothetical protein n=1 Tax=Alkalihalobacillus sp. MEB130 TaxID=2976704 RepID=UPI0028DFB252|nr:hypothetical protein [Alkalihalobacillus sp. MEB130]MDT8858698.1 hypothetical protein [Alkalihalobacillus sp. MEB130]
MQTMQNQQQSMNMQGGQQQQQMTYQTPPAIVTTKDHLYLNDMLSWNLLAMKKAHFFAQQCQDQEIKSVLEKTGQMHQRHYEKILSHLKTQQPQQSMPMQ